MKNNTSDSIFPFIKFHGSLVPISFAFSMDHQRVMACMEEPHGENQRANWIGTRFWPFLGTLGSGEKVKFMVLTDGFSCVLHCAQNAAGGMREFQRVQEKHSATCVVFQDLFVKVAEQKSWVDRPMIADLSAGVRKLLQQKMN